ncbi:MAG: metal-dependent transcriptional regulator [Clostridiales bacterium]|nr:metal-dependent transcriptional regulator [Clostridiales bacterium]MBT9259911.1 metal-dependent transcriptional regulator [Clostridiales bacterium]
MERKEELTPGRAVEDYLADIFRLQKESVSSHGAVATQEVAQRRKVSPASTTAMFKRLAREGLVAYREYQGVTLTPKGEQVALQVLRRHRIVERFLTDVLGIPWEEVDEMAHQMEHALPDSVVDAMERYMGEPRTCPHGFPIPDRKGHVEPLPRQTLAQVKAGQKVVISHVDERVEGLLTRLAQMDLHPGTLLQVVGRDDLDDLLVVEAHGMTHLIGPRMAQSIFVRPLD